MTENWKQFEGQSIDGFPLRRYLGGSASAGVFLTIEDETNLAIKLVESDPASDSARLDHWRAAEGMSHPHLLRVVRSGQSELDGLLVPYVAMEYAEENLSQILPQRALTVDEVREMLPAVLDALDYLHGQGFVHGSLWPGNIMAAGEQLKLSVDGIKRVGDSGVVATTYDAPEVAEGVSAASDVWSLGVTLVEGLTQRRPEWTTGTQALQLPESLVEPFRAIAEHCLAREAGSRCSTAKVRELLKQKTSATVAKPVAAVVKASEPVAAAKPVAAKAVAAKAVAGSGGGAKKYVIVGASAVVAIGTVIAISQRSDKAPEPKTETAAVIAAEPKSETPAASKPESASMPARESKKPSAEVIAEDTVRQSRSQRAKASDAPKEVHEQAPTAPVKTAARVEKASGNARDAIVDQVMPDIPRKAMNTINGKFHVKVKVNVDQQGNVAKSEFTSAGPSRYFANLTMQAVKQWKFAPSQEQARAWNLDFEFRRSGATVNPVQVNR